MEFDAFRKSLGWLWEYQCLYDFENKQDFLKTYIQNNDYVTENIQLPNYDAEGSFENDLISTILSVYEMERQLDILDNGNGTFKEYQLLAEQCSFTANLLSFTLMKYEFEQEKPLDFNNHYNVAAEIQEISKVLLSRINFENFINELESEVPICMKTDYDNLNKMFILRYIKSYFMLIKIIVILCVMTKSRYYEDHTKDLAKTILLELRELLYNKRINKIYFSKNIGTTHCDKQRTTTKLEIFFSMNNTDCYCLRLDFPHAGVNYIHLNINEPEKKSSSGFPVKSIEIEDLIDLCGSEENFSSLFYFQDDFYWFRSNFATKVKDIYDNNKELESRMLEFQSTRRHKKIGDNKSEQDISDFVVAFNTATIEYGIEDSPYNILDGTENKLFQYIKFQDHLFTISVKLQKIHQDYILLNKADDELMELETYIKIHILLCIKRDFADDSELVQLFDAYDDYTLAEMIKYCVIIINEHIL